MTVYGSSVSIVKNAIYAGLTTALGDDASVLYEAPTDPNQLISESDERVFVCFDDEISGELDLGGFGGGLLRYDETYTVPLRLVVIDEQRDQDDTLDWRARQKPVDQRLDELIGAVLEWFADQDNVPDSGGAADEIQIHSVTPTSFRRESAALSATAGRVAVAVIQISVMAHKEP